MTTLHELIEEGKQRRVTYCNKDGRQLLELSLLWTVIIAFAAPQLALIVLFLALLDVLKIKIDEKDLGLIQPEKS